MVSNIKFHRHRSFLLFFKSTNYYSKYKRYPLFLGNIAGLVLERVEKRSKESKAHNSLKEIAESTLPLGDRNYQGFCRNWGFPTKGFQAPLYTSVTGTLEKIQHQFQRRIDSCVLKQGIEPCLTVWREVFSQTSIVIIKLDKML